MTRTSSPAVSALSVSVPSPESRAEMLTSVTYSGYYSPIVSHRTTPRGYGSADNLGVLERPPDSDEIAVESRHPSTLAKIILFLALISTMRPGKAPVSCIACAKRKVRCDRQMPCCNCKRRPQDACEYPTTPAVPDKHNLDQDRRILELERYIQRLGHDPKDASSPTHPAGQLAVASPTTGRSSGEIVVQPAVTQRIHDLSLAAENEELTYIESPMWYSFAGLNSLEDDTSSAPATRKPLPPSVARGSYSPSLLDPGHRHGSHHDPVALSMSQVDFLWSTFRERVHPFVKIFFDWEVVPIIRKARDSGSHLGNTEKALFFAIVFMTVTSLSMEEYSCVSSLVPSLLTMYSQLAMNDRGHPATIHSLMGVAIRIAERMGLHRDGQRLGLSPLRTEERRRMWWQLQYMELTVARFVGSMTLTLFADWDSRMPSNLEDEDLSLDTTALPPERTKLTSISQCLWCYNVLNANRTLQRANNGEKNLAWVLSPTVSLADKDAVLDKVESMLRSKFLQYCEPLDPLHMNLQLGICQYILAGRRLMRQPALADAKISAMSRESRDDLLGICTKGLEYSNMAQTSDALKPFLWHSRLYFPWVAFIYVILESYHRFDQDAVADLWSLIGKTYAAYPELTTTVHRQDIMFAARITSASWERYRAHIARQSPAVPLEPPSWILDLCHSFCLPRPGQTSAEADEGVFPDASQLVDVMDFNFDTVDWAMWDESFTDQGLFMVDSTS
ncbi:hypothetical protein FZEAL_6215 [Fusarium zealandicum]|uniref:Zn(2)-C6 fungal-type domain-containing protein n=1 Tax=Fusarium zealandicum TaxID=1053134 RepID=A0A8H4XK37_9HYPO|nr:hypothetical protein FZEAL_6215 [Fusarium zealandicum]